MGVQLTKKQTKTGYAFYAEVTDTCIIFIKGYGSDHSWSERCLARPGFAAYRPLPPINGWEGAPIVVLP